MAIDPITGQSVDNIDRLRQSVLGQAIEKAGTAAFEFAKTAVNYPLREGSAKAQRFGALPITISQPLIFPNDLTNGQDQSDFIVMKLAFGQYNRNNTYDPGTVRNTSNIYLPIPNNLIDSQGVHYSPTTTDPLTQAAVNTIGKTVADAYFVQGGSLADIGNQLVRGVENLPTMARSQAENIAVGFGTGLLRQTPLVGGAFGSGLDRTLQLQGRALNPFLSLMFQQPQFRSFGFQWTLAPKNENETNTLAAIIRTIKASMLPALDGTDRNSTFLLYPLVVEPSFVPNDFGFKFKRCVINDLRVNYAPTGTPSFFKRTNQPTMVELTLQLTEIEYWVSNEV